MFGEIVNGGMVLNDFGKIAFHELHKTSEIRKNMKIDYFVIMPNHLHAIVVIDNPIVVGAYCNMPLRDEQNKCQSPSNNLGSMVCGYKSTLTKQINELRKTPQQRIWQRNYHEHIIRNEKSLKMIREYILNNPQKWENDKFFIS